MIKKIIMLLVITHFCLLSVFAGDEHGSENDYLETHVGSYFKFDRARFQISTNGEVTPPPQISGDSGTPAEDEISASHEYEGENLGEIWLEIGEEINFETTLDPSLPLKRADESVNAPNLNWNGLVLDCGIPTGGKQKCRAVRFGKTRVSFELTDYSELRNIDGENHYVGFKTDFYEVYVGGRDLCVDFQEFMGFERRDLADGKNQFKPGIVNFQREPHYDFCEDEQILVEYFCDGNSVGEEKFTCEEGCENAACIVPESLKTDYAVLDIKVESEDCWKCGNDKTSPATTPIYRIYAKVENLGKIGDRFLKSADLQVQISAGELNRHDLSLDEVLFLQAGGFIENLIEDLNWFRLGWVRQAEVSDNDTITVIIDPENDVAESNENNNSFSRTFGLAKKPARTFMPLNPFFDINPETEIGKAALFVEQKSMIDGYPDGTFGAESQVNRAEAAKILLGAKSDLFVPKVSGETGFSDVKATAWYARFVVKAAELKIINGYQDGTFRPNNTVKVEEFAKMLTLALELPVAENDTNPWWKLYFDALEKFSPKFLDLPLDHKMTRGEVAIAIWEVMTNENFPDKF